MALTPPAAPGPAELFRAFMGIGLSGFGGVLPWARRALVDERGWLSGDEFAGLLGLCQFLPGPNVVNLSVAVGARFAGARGALAAFAGLMLMPFVLVILLGALYGRYGQFPAVAAAFEGIGSAAAGLILAMGIRMAAGLRGPLFAALAFAGIALLHWPLPAVLLVLAPLSVAVAWRRR